MPTQNSGIVFLLTGSNSVAKLSPAVNGKYRVIFYRINTIIHCGVKNFKQPNFKPFQRFTLVLGYHSGTISMESDLGIGYRVERRSQHDIFR